MPNNPGSLRLRLKAYLQHDKISAEAFAAAIGRTPETVRKYLRGGASPKVDVLLAIARVYPHWSLRYLIAGQGPAYQALAPKVPAQPQNHRQAAQHWLGLKHTVRQQLAVLPIDSFHLVFAEVLAQVDELLQENEDMALRLQALQEFTARAQDR